MTQHKHLKQLIRDRMKQTGLRYAAARRSILQAIPIGGTPHRPGCNFGATVLRILLAQAGRQLSEAMVFGIAGGVGIGVFSFCYEKEDFVSFFIAGRHCWHDHLLYLQRAAERFGMSTVVTEASSPSAAEKRLRQMLDDHGTCVAWVDLGALPHRGLPPNPMASGYHLVTVYSATDEIAMIGDLTDEPIEIAMKDLTAARGRIKKDKFRLLALRPTDAPFDMRAAVESGLRACQQGLDGDNGPSNARQNFSLNALSNWAKRLTTAKGSDSWRQVFARGKRLFLGLTSVYQFIEHYGTGGGLIRPLMADFLEEAGKKLANDKLTDLGESYRKIGDMWSKLADIALPDDVPSFSECKQAFERYTELCHWHGSLDDKRQCWKDLQELERKAATEFPLKSSECDALTSTMAEWVLALYDEEVAAQQRLLEVQ